MPNDLPERNVFSLLCADSGIYPQAATQLAEILAEGLRQAQENKTPGAVAFSFDGFYRQLGAQRRDRNLQTDLVKVFKTNPYLKNALWKAMGEEGDLNQKYWSPEYNTTYSRLFGSARRLSKVFDTIKSPKELKKSVRQYRIGHRTWYNSVVRVANCRSDVKSDLPIWAGASGASVLILATPTATSSDCAIVLISTIFAIVSVARLISTTTDWGVAKLYDKMFRHRAYNEWKNAKGEISRHRKLRNASLGVLKQLLTDPAVLENALASRVQSQTGKDISKASISGTSQKPPATDAYAPPQTERPHSYGGSISGKLVKPHTVSVSTYAMT